MSARLLPLLLGVFASCALAADWPGFQGNPAHTGYVPQSLNTSEFALKWQITGANGQPLNPVAVGDGKVLVSNPSYFGDAGLYAYDAASGASLWHVEYSGLHSVNPPAYANGRVYIQTGKVSSSSTPPYLRAYEASTGQLAFQSAFDAQWENYYAPTVFDDVVYVNGGSYGGMYAFSAIDGTRKWFVGLNQYDRWTPAVDSIYAYAYTGSYSPALTVVNRQTGLVAYSISDPGFEWNGWSMNLAPVLGGANDVLAIHDGRLIRFDVGSRIIAWELQRNFSGQPSVAKGVIYAIDGGALTAWNQSTGTLLWSWGSGLSGPMIVTDTHVLVSGSSSTYAVNLGTRLSDWSYPVAGQLALADHALYIAAANGTLTAFRVAPPGAYDDAATAYLSTPLGIDVLGNDDGFESPVTVSIATGPGNGTATVNNSPGDPSVVNVTYTPNAGFEGLDTFQYSADDGALADTATVTVTVATPQANPDVAETHLYTPVAINVLANDPGFSGLPVTATVTGGPLQGTAVVTGSPGDAAALRINYTPSAGFTGSDSLQYEVTNGINTASATVSITVLPYKAVNDSYYVLSNYGYTYLYVAANDLGFQEPVTLTILSGPAQGSAYVYNSPGSRSNVAINYYVSGGEAYDTTMSYALSDGVRTDTATVTVHVVPYIAQDDTATTGSGNPVEVSIVQNDLGFSYPRNVSLFTNPQHGSATVNNGNPGYCCVDATVTYTPNPGFLGNDTFQYAIDDGSRTAIATVTVHVIRDADNDQVDDGNDNCLGVANSSQRDSDGDGYGNMCDADLDNNGKVNFADLAMFRSAFGTVDPNYDLNGDGRVNFADLAILKSWFGKPPGPSAVAP
jgi:hypothetical protein